MGVNARQYREHIYRLRAHPDERRRHDFVDSRDNLAIVYASIIPFLALEYIAERSYEILPSGVVCPFGYLLFWAVFFTYYRPGFLEDNLKAPERVDIRAVLGILVGVLIWFVKVTVVELSHLFLIQWIVAKKPARNQAQDARAASGRPRGFRPGQEQWRGTGSYRSRPAGAGARQEQRQSTGNTYYGQRPASAPPPPRPPSSLPPDVRSALEILGLGETNDWHEVHKRYRELAKKYHPDLNHEITEVGRRFIRIDTAYRKLVSVKARYFVEKRA